MDATTARSHSISRTRRVLPAAVLIAGLGIGALVAGQPGRVSAAGLVTTAAASVSPASLWANVTTINPGGTISLSGTGYAPNEPITITLTGAPGLQLTAQADASGNLPATPVTIPSSQAVGTYSLAATGTTSGSTAAISLAVTNEALTVSTVGSAGSAAAIVSTVTPGEAVTVSGDGFAAAELVTISLNGVAGALTTVTADASGHLPVTTFTIPSNVSTGSYTLSASGATSGNISDSQLTVIGGSGATVNPFATVYLSINSGIAAPGGYLTISASGFAANEPVTVSLSGSGGSLATGQANALGQLLSSTIQIPASAAPGWYTLTVTGTTSGANASELIYIGTYYTGEIL